MNSALKSAKIRVKACNGAYYACDEGIQKRQTLQEFLYYLSPSTENKSLTYRKYISAQKANANSNFQR